MSSEMPVDKCSIPIKAFELLEELKCSLAPITFNVWVLGGFVLMRQAYVV